MSIAIALAAVAAVSAGRLVAQTGPDIEKDRAAILQAALDYAEGFYEGAADRMERAVSSALAKRGLTGLKPGGAPVLVPMNAGMLIETTRLGRGKLPADQRALKAEVLDIHGDLASAKVFTARFNDFLHLAREDGRWRLVNVLWRPPASAAAADSGKERAEVQQAAQEFVDAIAQKAADRLGRVIHPLLVMRLVITPGPPAKTIFYEVNSEALVEGVRAGMIRLAPDGAAGTVTILDVYEDIASVKAVLGPSTQYLHLARQNGQWRVANALLPAPPPAAPASERR